MVLHVFLVGVAAVDGAGGLVAFHFVQAMMKRMGRG